MRGYAFPLLTGYTDWDDIVVYDDHVKIDAHHPQFRHDLIGEIMVVWITARKRGTFGIHARGKNRTFGTMQHATTLEEAYSKFHRLRGKATIQTTLF